MSCIINIMRSAFFVTTFTAATMTATAMETDSLSMRTGMTDWVDPIKAVPDNCVYVTYPSPHRGEGTEASCLVYLPPAYQTDSLSRYPVIYYLHGGTGNQREVRWLIKRVDSVIKSGSMNPAIIVSPQALPIGWYINANTNDKKVLSGPIEDVLIKDLIPYIDNHFRTRASRESRGIEGFSMGGRGALMLAFKHPELFGSASSVAGAVVDWDEEPLQRALECTFGDINSPLSKVYFNAWHPMTFACQNRDAIVDSGMKIRMFVGNADRLYEENGNHITDRFHSRLDTLGIPHTYTIVPGANHNPEEIFGTESIPYATDFWDMAFMQSDSIGIPAEILSFAKEYFPNERIVSVTSLPDPRGTHYVMRLGNGDSVKFNEHFKWIRIEAGAGQHVPASIIHNGIQTYLASQHLNVDRVIRIEKIPKVGYDVMLADGNSLLFNTEGHLIPPTNR